jgi:uncharacterized protein YrrD
MALKTARELAGLAVVTLTGGERLGRVADVVFRPANGQVAGFLVDRGGMFSKPRFLASAQVQGLGADALTVEGETALAEAAPAEAEGLAAKPLEGRPVLSQAGTVLGKVADVAVDTEALLVPYLLLATGLLDNALHGKPQLPLSLVQTVGADSVIVSNAYDPKAPATSA